MDNSQDKRDNFAIKTVNASYGQNIRPAQTSGALSLMSNTNGQSPWHQDPSAVSKKIEKLVTALYMVTDFIMEHEPVRGKLRTLGLELITDIHTYNIEKAVGRKKEIISVINVAMTLGIISNMNGSILVREFSVMKDILEEKQEKRTMLPEGLLSVKIPAEGAEENSSHRANIKGQNSLNTQKVISQRQEEMTKSNSTNVLNENKPHMSALLDASRGRPKMILSNLLNKSGRREEVLKFIREKVEVNIKDITGSNVPALSICSEKTIQRELLSLMNDGLIKRTGDKRWSKYSLA